MSVDDEWCSFMNNDDIDLQNSNLSIKEENKEIPECEELYISTKTKVMYLSTAVDIENIFWKLPIIEYSNPSNGIVKKQMKIVSNTEEEYEKYKEKLKGITYYTENIIKQINNPSARRTKFKDERKITIGMSKKDIMNCRGKKKNAFYNCFAIIIRFKFEDIFREIHVKVFNTGKLEIPGILNVNLMNIVKEMVLSLLIPYIGEDLKFVNEEIENNVLINSNFNCGYFINRDILYSLLRTKYGIETAYDPCSYPGVKSKFYFNNEYGFSDERQKGILMEEDRGMKMSELNENKKYTEISFMIFRTGSCLIVGNCSEKVLYFVYNYIKKILYDEYNNIHIETDETIVKEKKVKLRKKVITLSLEYFNEIYK